MDMYLVVLCVFVGVGVAGACNETALATCTALLTPPFVLTETAQITLCNNIGDVDACAATHSSGCNDTYEVLRWESLRSAYDYVCSRVGLRFNPDMSECYLTDPDVQLAIDICRNQTEMQRLDANANCSTVVYDYECFCNAYNDNCGKQAASHYACELSRQYFTPIDEIDYNNCAPLSTYLPTPDFSNFTTALTTQSTNPQSSTTTGSTDNPGSDTSGTSGISTVSQQQTVTSSSLVPTTTPPVSTLSLSSILTSTTITGGAPVIEATLILLGTSVLTALITQWT